jgi:YfiH family protein
MIKTNEPFLLLNFNKLEDHEIQSFVTTRLGGVSDWPYSSLNLGLHTKDNPIHVIKNRELLAEAFHIPVSQVVYANQVHSGKVTIVTQEDIAQGAFNFTPETDALVTNLIGICLMVMVADCVPILLFDPVKKVVAAIHAGWRGTLKAIVRNTVMAMQTAYGTNPKDLIAGIGPSIGPCCYEVGLDVKKEVESLYDNTEGILKTRSDTKFLFDLWQANYNQLIECGVSDSKIEIAKMCTQCNNDIFYSSRASHGITGRFCAGIYIK